MKEEEYKYRYTVMGNSIRVYESLKTKEALINFLDVIYSDPRMGTDIYLSIPNKTHYKETIQAFRDSSAFAEDTATSKMIFRGPTGEVIQVERKRDLYRPEGGYFTGHE